MQSVGEIDGIQPATKPIAFLLPAGGAGPHALRTHVDQIVPYLFVQIVGG